MSDPSIARPRRWLMVWLLFGLLLPVQRVSAQTAETASLPAITPGEIKAQMESAASNEGLDEETRKELKTFYGQTLGYLEKAQSHQSSAAGYAKALLEAPKQGQALRRELEGLKAERPSEIDVSKLEEMPLAELEQRLVKAQADLSSVALRLSELDKQIQEQAERPAAIRDRLVEAKKELEEVSSQLQKSPAEGEKSALETARRQLLVSRQRALRAETHMLDQELLSQPARLELLKAQRDHTAHTVAGLEKRVKSLQDLVNRRRSEQAAQAQAKAVLAEQQAQGKSPIIQELARRNAELGKMLATLASRLQDVLARKESMEQQAKDFERELQSARQKLQIAGLSRSLGRVLLEERRQLPNPDRLGKSIAARGSLIGELGLQELRHEEELRDLSDLDGAVARLLSEVPAEQREALSGEIKELLKSRRALLKQVVTTERAYLRALGDLEFAQRRLAEVVKEYDHFLGENLLWIPNAPVAGPAAIRELPQAVSWLLSPANWSQVGQSLLRDVRIHLLLWVLALVVFGSALWYRPRVNEVLKDLARRVSRLSTYRMGYTIQATGLTLVLALPWPALMAYVGWRLGAATEDVAFPTVLGHALLRSALPFLLLRAFGLFCAPGGVAEAHFRWPADILAVLRRQIRWLTGVLVPAAFVVQVARWDPEHDFENSLGRLALLVGLLALTLFLHRVFHPDQGALAPFYAKHRQQLLGRLRYLWYMLAVGMPIALMVLSLVGYIFTALALARNLVNTLWFVLAVVIVYELIERAVVLARRRIDLEIVRRQREEVLAQREQGTSGPEGEQETAEAEESLADLDLDAIDAQSRTLMDTVVVVAALVGLWLIWANVLPALGILDKVGIWQHPIVSDGVEKLVPVTLADAALAVVIGIITAVAVRNLPGVLEIVLLQRLGMDAGSRYTVTTLTTYTLVAAGTVIIFNLLGGSWSEIKWLVAAMGVGLGFGLQEIVANFISGLIILFERPIRVGDIVTVGDTTGAVTRIRIRATTITNWDKQELLVPNKDFITSQLLNWTLSNQLNRIVIVVGVAYGSKVKKAMALIAEAAQENENILEDPAPMVTFEGFDDSSLRLLLRCYLDSMDVRLSTTSALHAAINQKFEDHDIVIAFPQRDVHLDTNRPLDVCIRGEGITPAGGSGARDGAQ